MQAAVYPCGFVATYSGRQRLSHNGSPGIPGLSLRMTILEQLIEDPVWQDFLAYKQAHNLMDREERLDLEAFVADRAYRPLASAILEGNYKFSIPLRRELNKQGTSKKRVVYTYSEDENKILKLLAYLLYRYDDQLAPNCYAFRRHIGVRRAFSDLAFDPQVRHLWGYKTDISNYFNSIDSQRLVGILEAVIADDPPLLALLSAMLLDGRALWQNQVICEERGAMAGTPTSPFLANLYLKEMDFYFARAGVRYARYSDDILLFDSQEALAGHVARIGDYFEAYGLHVNPEKEVYIEPGQAWTFLGFQYEEGEIDIAPASLRKLLGRIRRSARSIRRWMLRKEADPLRTLKAFNRKFNRKFYSASGRDLCWSRWFFPLITTDASLRVIDHHMQQYQRYIVTGRHNKASRGQVPYAMLQEAGYRPLVTAYHKRRIPED